MISFRNDYSEGCISEIMEYINKTNLDNTIGYGEDKHCEKAKMLIRKQLKNDKVDIHFLVGGTQTNLVMISHALKPYQSVISADSGHISTHETGAIESTGHKVVEMATSGDGKLTIDIVKKAFLDDLPPHTVQKKMVYISNPTEMGTVYTKKELEQLSKYCKKNNLYLYLDGARLAMALTSEKNDIALSDYPKYVDAFYIGGTKCGALFGEALVIVNDNLKKDIAYVMKQKGALLAKGRLLGIQFEKLFQKNLYEKYGKHANEMSKMLKDGFIKYGLTLKSDSYTNQQFLILPNDLIKILEKKYIFEFWSKEDENNSTIRFVTSWATKKSDVTTFLKELKNLI
ncbi:threonine aldolase family protein [Fusobacterium sp. PH5-44]|uniref:threonine aldolase family protein n=1 Tax=unclassified Fusobacterium TaxID=2648384 RepID=UPI003D1A8872